MRITHIYPFIHRRGGIERYLVELIHQQSRSHKICIVANEVEWDQLPTSPKPDLLQTPCWKWPAFLSSISFCFANVWTRLGHQTDISNAQGASAFFCDIVTAQSVHKAWFNISRGRLRVGSKAWWLKILNPMHYATIAIETWQYRCGGCKAVIAISQTVKNELMQYHKIRAEKIRVIYSGVNLEMFRPDLRDKFFETRKNLFGLNHDDLLMIFVGNEFRRKGLQVILEAIGKLQNSKLHLLVVGGDDPAPFALLASELKIYERVHFQGRSGEIPKLMAMSDLFVFPTSYEPFGLVITEAMASGLAVITSAIAGAAELIQDGQDGLLLTDPSNPEELAQKIAILLDSQVRRTMGIAARRKSELYSFEACAGQTEELYEEILAQRKTTSQFP